MEDKKYFSKAWALLTRDKGWFKPLLVMSVATMVPVAGWLGVSGYGLEWARLTAWNIDSSPKQKNVAVGACIASGWRGFVVSLGLSLGVGLVFGVVAGILGVIPGVLGGLIQAIVSLASAVLCVVIGPLVQIAEIRAAIYERIAAGYRLQSVFEMVKRDKNGFFKLVLIFFCSTLVTGVASFILAIFVVVPLSPVLYAAATHDSYLLFMSLSQTLVWLILVLIVVMFAITFLQCGIYLITITATALWMRQFDVASWGRSEDPLPASTVAEQSAPVHPAQETYETQGGYAAPVPTAEPTPAQEPQYLAPANEVPAEQSQPSEMPAPVPEPPSEPVAEPQPAPVAEPQPAPIEAPVEAPAEERAEERVEEPVAEPVEEPVAEQPAPAENPDDAPTIRLKDREEASDAVDVSDKDVDELYADLYEVIQDNDRSKSCDEGAEE